MKKLLVIAIALCMYNQGLIAGKKEAKIANKVGGGISMTVTDKSTNATTTVKDGKSMSVTKGTTYAVATRGMSQDLLVNDYKTYNVSTNNDADQNMWMVIK